MLNADLQTRSRLLGLLESAGTSFWSLRVFAEKQVQVEYLSESVEKLLGYSREQLVENPALWKKILREEDYNYFRWKNAYSPQSQVEICITTATEERRWVRLSWKTEQEEASLYLQGWAVDITEQQQLFAEKNLLEDRLSFEQLVAELALKTVGAEETEFDQQVHALLQSCGQVARAARASTYQLNYDTKQAVRSHEWCAPGVPPRMIRVRPLAENSQEILSLFASGKPLWFSSIKGFLPDIQKELIAENVQAVLLTPMLISKQIIGFINIEWSEPQSILDQQLARISTICAQLVGSALVRRKAEEKLNLLNAELEQRIAERTLALSTTNLELEAALKHKDEFLACMSHELRTPLNAILGITEVLMEGVYGAVGVSQARSLGTIHSSGQHLLALINDLLDLAKINSGKLELELELVGVEELCLQCLRMVREKAAARQVTVSWSWDGEVSMMQADGRRLKQILLNLLSNAEKFTAVGGRIGLEVQKGGAGQVQFSVWDTGVGISTEFHTKIFEPFYQLAQGGVRDGTGLGLALVQRLTILHGGSVTISSESGQGSRFTVILPTGSGVVSPLTGLPIAAPSRGPLKGRHLLLVEDNETSAAFLRDFLISSGADIVWAKDGLEALNQVTAFQPDLILMDIQLPKLDGLEVTRILRRQGFKKPILALTALASPADQEHCLEAGASAWMSKPASLPELLHTLHRLLASW